MWQYFTIIWTHIDEEIDLAPIFVTSHYVYVCGAE